jgi:hypothetical protein
MVVRQAGGLPTSEEHSERKMEPGTDGSHL